MHCGCYYATRRLRRNPEGKRRSTEARRPCETFMRGSPIASALRSHSYGSKKRERKSAIRKKGINLRNPNAWEYATIKNDPESADAKQQQPKHFQRRASTLRYNQSIFIGNKEKQFHSSQSSSSTSPPSQSPQSSPPVETFLSKSAPMRVESLLEQAVVGSYRRKKAEQTAPSIGSYRPQALDVGNTKRSGFLDQVGGRGDDFEALRGNTSEGRAPHTGAITAKSQAEFSTHTARMEAATEVGSRPSTSKGRFNFSRHGISVQINTRARLRTSPTSSRNAAIKSLTLSTAQLSTTTKASSPPLPDELHLDNLTPTPSSSQHLRRLLSPSHKGDLISASAPGTPLACSVETSEGRRRGGAGGRKVSARAGAVSSRRPFHRRSASPPSRFKFLIRNFDTRRREDHGYQKARNAVVGKLYWGRKDNERSDNNKRRNRHIASTRCGASTATTNGLIDHLCDGEEKAARQGMLYTPRHSAENALGDNLAATLSWINKADSFKFEALSSSIGTSDSPEPVSGFGGEFGVARRRLDRNLQSRRGSHMPLKRGNRWYRVTKRELAHGIRWEAAKNVSIPGKYEFRYYRNTDETSFELGFAELIECFLCVTKVPPVGLRETGEIEENDNNEEQVGGTADDKEEAQIGESNKSGSPTTNRSKLSSKKGMQAMSGGRSRREIIFTEEVAATSFCFMGMESALRAFRALIEGGKHVCVYSLDAPRSIDEEEVNEDKKVVREKAERPETEHDQPLPKNDNKVKKFDVVVKRQRGGGGMGGGTKAARNMSAVKKNISALDDLTRSIIIKTQVTKTESSPKRKLGLPPRVSIRALDSETQLVIYWVNDCRCVRGASGVERCDVGAVGCFRQSGRNAAGVNAATVTLRQASCCLCSLAVTTPDASRRLWVEAVESKGASGLARVAEVVDHQHSRAPSSPNSKMPGERGGRTPADLAR
eukprot:jgi/Bigna1/80846/fgenesh1_pg.75_\